VGLGEVRPPADRLFDISPALPVAVAGDVADARDAVRPWLAFYFGAMGAPEKNFYVELAERHGHGASAREVQRRYLAGDRGAAAAALTDELIDDAAVATTADALADRLAVYREAGATSVVAVPCGDRVATVEALARVATA